MSRHPMPWRRRPEDWDRILDGAPPADERLGGLLGAARQPAAPGEQQGLDAAVAAFAAAGDEPVDEVATRRRRRLVGALAGASLLTKLVVGATVATAAAGVTYAAVEYRSHNPRPVHTSVAPSTPGSDRPSGSTPPRSGSPSAPSSGATTTTPATPSGSVSGLPTTSTPSSPSASSTSGGSSSSAGSPSPSKTHPSKPHPSKTRPSTTARAKKASQTSRGRAVESSTRGERDRPGAPGTPT